jgi:hypothetical protein
MNHIAYTTVYNIDGNTVHFGGLKSAFSFGKEKVIFTSLLSPWHYFPVDSKRGLTSLLNAFTVLYPLIDTIVAAEDGRTPRLTELLDILKHWYVEKWTSKRSSADDSVSEEEEDVEPPNIPELDSYHFVRTGLWWDVLSRDNWTCCSCGRSTKKHGVVLHVDHIVPRSKGGTDDIENLQTLCQKCNIGKSNRDDTDLRRM